MYLLFDLLFVAILYASVYFAGKKGLVGEVRGLLSFGIAALCSFFLCGPVSRLFADSFLQNGIYRKAKSALGGMFGITPESGNAAATELIESENGTIAAIDRFSSGNLLSDLRGEISAGADNLAETLLSALANGVTGILLRVIAFVALLLLGWLGIALLLRYLDRVSKKGGLVGGLNLGLGFTLGVVRGLALCILLANVGEWFLRWLGESRGWDVTAMLGGTWLFRFFSNVFLFL